MQRHTQTRKDGQRHTKTRKDTQRRQKTNKDGKKTFEVDKDTQRRTKTRKDGKKMFKVDKFKHCSFFIQVQSDQSLCLSLEYPMIVKLPTKHYLEFLSLKGGCAGPSESTLVKMPHCWKSHVAAHITFKINLYLDLGLSEVINYGSQMRCCVVS